MAREFGRWFRFYDGVLDDPKVQRLPDKLFRAWVNLMCLASRRGGRIEADHADIGFSLRISEGEARDTLQALASAGLMDIEADAIEPHNWDERQFKSDVTDPTAAERMRRKRAKDNERSTVTEIQRNATVTVTATRTDTDTDTDQKQSKAEGERSRARAAPSKSKPECFTGDPKPKTARATRWPPDAIVPDDWLDLGKRRRVEAGLPEIDLRLQATLFANYWSSKAGGGAAHMDWQKTWVNWCLKAYENGRNAGQSGHRLGDFGEILERERDKGTGGEPDGSPGGGVRKAQGSFSGDDRSDGRGVVQSLALLSDRDH